MVVHTEHVRNTKKWVIRCGLCGWYWVMSWLRAA